MIKKIILNYSAFINNRKQTLLEKVIFGFVVFLTNLIKHEKQKNLNVK